MSNQHEIFFSSYLTNVILRQFSFALIELGIFKTTPEQFHRKSTSTLHWRHNDHDGVSNHQPHDCLLNRLFRRRSKKTSKLRVTGLCVGKSPETGEIRAQRASNAENVSIWWRHHGVIYNHYAINLQVAVHYWHQFMTFTPLYKYM